MVIQAASLLWAKEFDGITRYGRWLMAPDPDSLYNVTNPGTYRNCIERGNGSDNRGLYTAGCQYLFIYPDGSSKVIT